MSILSLGYEELLDALRSVQAVDLQLDSRMVDKNSVFVARPGTQTHGLAYVDQLKDCAAVLCAEYDARLDNLAFPVFIYKDLAAALGRLARDFYLHDVPKRPVFGVCGTDGKTSVATYIAQLLSDETPAQVIGTLGTGAWNALTSGINTTPDIFSIYRALSHAATGNAPGVAMEVSSHALVQERVQGLRYDGRILTNVRSDHLDYHKSLDNYRAAKARFAKTDWGGAFLYSADDPVAASIGLATPGSVSYGWHIDSDYRISKIELHAQGSQFTLEHSGLAWCINSPLLGQFNIQNLVAALAVLNESAVLTLSAAVEKVASIEPVSGRMECLSKTGAPTAVIDYAHTDQALETILTAVRAHCSGKLLCVFGCGGDRDAQKRPKMGAVAERYADRVFVTDDNPRNESPAKIFADIAEGMERPERASWCHDRARATQDALDSAEPQDWVVIAGKGHEQYQIRGDLRDFYSDQAVVKDWLSGRGNQ